MDSATTDPIVRNLAGIRARFVSELPSRRADLEFLTHGLESSADRVDRLERARRIAHRLVGVAGTLGFPKLGRVAERAEDDLATAASLDSDQMVLEAVTHAVEALCDVMTHVAVEGCDCDDADRRHPGASSQVQD